MHIFIAYIKASLMFCLRKHYKLDLWGHPQMMTCPLPPPPPHFISCWLLSLDLLPNVISVSFPAFPALTFTPTISSFTYFILVSVIFNLSLLLHRPPLLPRPLPLTSIKTSFVDEPHATITKSNNLMNCGIHTGSFLLAFFPLIHTSIML